MKNVFLDCGTHYGQGLKQFIKKYDMDESWEIHTFEPNPKTYKHFLNEGLPNIKNKINHYNTAIFTHDGTIKFNQEKPVEESEEYGHADESGMGSSLVPLTHWRPHNGKLFFLEPIEVKCINLSEFINNLKFDGKLVIKMDIEGAEYDVLGKMLNDGTLRHVTDLYVEFHAKFFSNQGEIEQREQSIKNEIYKMNILFEEWH